MRLSSGQKSFISCSAKGEIVFRSAQGANEAVGVDAILTKGSGCLRRRDNMLEKGYSTSNPTLLNVELMYSTTCLDVDVPGRDSLKVFVRWYLLRHHRVGTKCLSRPGRKADHPMKP